MKPKSSKLTVVFDTNVFISAILFGGNARDCLDLARAEKITLVTSKIILLELGKKLHGKFLWRQSDVEEAIRAIGAISILVAPSQRIHMIKADEIDNRILEAAVEGKANYIISGDKRHILPLRQFQGIKIVTPAGFINKENLNPLLKIVTLGKRMKSVKRTPRNLSTTIDKYLDS